jgi:hypothetical protein
VLLLSLSPLLGSPDTSLELFQKFFRGRPALRLLERLDLCVGRAGQGGLDSVGTQVAMAPCDVYDAYVIRKQLYISDEHDRALKARASELGISEAELVRRMLDSLLLDREGGEGLPGRALRRPWKVSWRRPTSWRSPTVSREGMCSTETGSTRIAYEASLGDGYSLCCGHQFACLRPEPEGSGEA